MIYILMVIFEVLLFSCKKSDIPKFKTEEERLAYIKELERKRKQQRDLQEKWINVERPRLIREAGLDPNNPEHVKVWKAQRKAENKKKREIEWRKIELEAKQYQSDYYQDVSKSSSYSSEPEPYSYDMSDDALEKYIERENNKGVGEKIIDFLLWTP
ncbi:MAG TPA: hypothetical protein PLX95_02090 [bacterium]|nr:hypothetical protein [bacterium]